LDIVLDTQKIMSSTKQQPLSQPKAVKIIKQYSIKSRIAYVKEFLESGSTNKGSFSKSKGVAPGTFKGWIKSYEAGELKLVEDDGCRIKSKSIRARLSNYDPIANDLVSFIRARSSNQTNNKRIPWTELKKQALIFAKNHLTDEELPLFKASEGWIGSVLSKNGLLSNNKTSHDGEEVGNSREAKSTNSSKEAEVSQQEAPLSETTLTIDSDVIDQPSEQQIDNAIQVLMRNALAKQNTQLLDLIYQIETHISNERLLLRPEEVAKTKDCESHDTTIQ